MHGAPSNPPTLYGGRAEQSRSELMALISFCLMRDIDRPHLTRRTATRRATKGRTPPAQTGEIKRRGEDGSAEGRDVGGQSQSSLLPLRCLRDASRGVTSPPGDHVTF
ncbi:hypothetical protein DPEC_G00075300 [Dallia pectoralis]|uniref:Uncharacterized protein n=1 Tax=Dallia pectoralis TaxID=75939 RepID=A0ACC2H3H2_DALPE|nr:hypothetical protein DPEC_G00075300 [Dallia pectoralis]